MRKIYLTVALAMGISAMQAQVGIGTTTPDASSELDITSTNRGFLMPRVALTSTTDTATITGAEATSLLVYNTATAGDVTPGFYYWNGTQWVTLGGASAAAWELLGNAGTTNGTNFIGTTDNQALDFRTNNVIGLTMTTPDGNNDIQLRSGTATSLGTETVPLYTFNGDVNTGIWSDGGDEFSLGGGGREFITVDEGATEGNVIIFNEDGDDMNFRVETDTNTNMFSVDGGDSQIRINESGGFFTGAHMFGGSSNATHVIQASTTSTGDAFRAQVTGASDGLFILSNNNGARGVFADLSTLTTDSDDAIIGHGNNNNGFGGGWFLNSNNADGAGYGSAEQGYGVLGMNTGASDYSAGVFGSVAGANGGGAVRSSGVYGTNTSGTSPNSSGSLGYKATGSNNYYGGYFFDNNGGVDHTDGTGFTGGGYDTSSRSATRTGAPTTPRTNVGFGAIGGLMGGWAKGAVYGFTAQGKRYSLYVDGREFTNNVITQLSDNKGGQRIATYVPTSTTVDVSSKGMSSLNSGTKRIAFKKEFSSMISSKEPVIVTVTPIGESKGIHLVSVDATGFTVKENNSGNSNVQFTWIAIATKKGFETVENPEELLAADYDEKLNYFMVDESIETPRTQEMWWDGSKIRYSGTPSPSEYSNKKVGIKEIKTSKSKQEAIEQLRNSTFNTEEDNE